jgi:hypothetical protein
MPRTFLIASAWKALLLTVIVAGMSIFLGGRFLVLLAFMIPMWITLDWIAYRRDHPKTP